MDGDQPAGGRWNFDPENRKRLPKGRRPPERHLIVPNPTTKEVMSEMEQRFPDNFGTLDCFNFQTNEKEAEAALDRFIIRLLPEFGDWQDFMVKGQPWMWHAHHPRSRLRPPHPKTDGDRQSAMLLGVHPDEINDWYMVVYADAFEWVELPNTHGMATFADGGIVGSKPYAASGAYINRMSDYCSRCAYDVKDRLGERACPFNALYWDFLDRNSDRLATNPRLVMPYRSLARMSADDRNAIHAQFMAWRWALYGELRNLRQIKTRWLEG